jgi:hypothetical protein
MKFTQTMLDEILVDLDGYDVEAIFAGAGQKQIARAYTRIGVEQGKMVKAGFAFDVSTKFTEDRIADLTTTFAKGVSDTALAEVKKALEYAVAEGLSVEEAADIVAGLGPTWTGRAEVVARTEIMRAANLGTLDAWKESGVVVEKVWATADDPCDICAPLDGVTVGIEEPFFKKGDEVPYISGDTEKTYSLNYGDVEAGALHPSCRCCIYALIK